MASMEIDGRQYEITNENKASVTEEILRRICNKKELEVEMVIEKLHKITHYGKSLLRDQFKKLNQPVKNTDSVEEKVSPDEQKHCMEYLKDKELFSNITDKELSKTIVGEQGAKKAIFLTGSGVWVENPGMNDNILVSGGSSGGKSYITKNVVKIFPKNRYVVRTRITRRALNYWKNTKTDPEWTWDGKILYLEDVGEDVLNSEVLKVMMTEGSSCTIVDKGKAVDIEVKGKPIVMMTTAGSEPNNELLNRLNLIKIDETAEQTEKIKEFQSKIEEGEIKTDYDVIPRKSLLLLKRVKVKVPFARAIGKCFPTIDLSVRRSFESFLKLIKNSCAIHQYQRREENEFYIAEQQDYEIAKDVWEFMYENNIAKKPLTARLEKGYKTCSDLTQELSWFSVKDARERNPRITEREWYRVINGLCKRDVLDYKEFDHEIGVRKVNKFRVKDIGKKIMLPSFKDLFSTKSEGEW